MRKKEKSVLVTGGAGFLGSNLINRLLRQNCYVTCVDNFVSSDEKNIETFLENPNFELIEADIRDPLIRDVSQIYNLASPASPPRYQKDPIFTLETNVLGSLNMLRLAAQNGARILQASTSEIYGDPVEHPQIESYWGNVNPIGIRSCYDEGKRCAETLFFDFHRQYNVDIRVARIFNTYGPGMDPKDGRVVSNFITQALLGENITIYGDGQQTRSFCYVDDLVCALDLFMNVGEQASSEGEHVTGPLNLGNPHELTVLEIATKILSLVGSKSKLVFKPMPLDDPVRRRPDIGRAKSLLDGWYPRVDLDTGLMSTVEYFEKRLLLL